MANDVAVMRCVERDLFFWEADWRVKLIPRPPTFDLPSRESCPSSRERKSRDQALDLTTSVYYSGMVCLRT